MIRARRLFLVPAISAFFFFTFFSIFGLLPWLGVVGLWYFFNQDQIEAYFKAKQHTKKEYADRESLK